MSSKYAAAHESPSGPGDSRPTALQIIQDQGLQGQLSDRTILITGCSSGLGVETARALHATGATLYLTVRDVPKTEKNLGDLINSPRVHLIHLDLRFMASVRACAEEFKAKSQVLNTLIANAGVMACPESRTSDLFETQFGCNHLAHFLLFHELKEMLVSSSTPTSNSRVIMVSSFGHTNSTVNLANTNLSAEYTPWKAYGQSKTANIWMANEIERRYGSQGLHALSLHPGAIHTDLGRHITDEQKAAFSTDEGLKKLFKNAEQGAATTVWGAVAGELEGVGGKYLDDCEIAGALDEKSGPWGPGHAEWAFDAEGAKELWELSLELLGLDEK